MCEGFVRGKSVVGKFSWQEKCPAWDCVRFTGRDLGKMLEQKGASAQGWVLSTEPQTLLGVVLRWLQLTEAAISDAYDK